MYGRIKSVLKSLAKGRFVLVTSHAKGAPSRAENRDVKKPSFKLLKRAV